jgi:hypothetical protein
VTSHGKARTHAPAAEPVHLAPTATPPPQVNRRAFQKGSSQMASKGGWSCCFDDPIPLPRGGQLVTLQGSLARRRCGVALWRRAVTRGWRLSISGLAPLSR